MPVRAMRGPGNGRCAGEIGGIARIRWSFKRPNQARPGTIGLVQTLLLPPVTTFRTTSHYHPPDAIGPRSERSMHPNYATQVEQWPLERLIPHARNARTHSEDQVAQIAGSIAEFGFVNPVLVGDDGVLVAGHGRVMAARKLGLTEVPVIVLSHLTLTQRRALMIADNQIATNAGWNEEMLAAELAALRMNPSTSSCWASMMPISIACSPPPPRRTKPSTRRRSRLPDPVTRPGDIWICGEHRVLCGDATVLSDVEKLLDGELADMAFTDPPYNVNYANSAKDKLRGKNRPILNDALGDDFGAFLYDACVNLLCVTKGACYICMSSSELDALQKAFRAAGGKWSTFIVWAKNTFTLGRADYQRQYDRSSMAGRTGPTIIGAEPAIRAMCGSSTSRPRTIYIRR